MKRTANRATTIKSRVYDSIMSDILNGVYPSNHVINEKVLIEKYGVSKSPVRDALLELCNEGVLRSIPRYGYVIVPIPEKQLREILELRVLIECENLRAIFGLLTGDCIESLRDIVRYDLTSIQSRSYTVVEHWQNNVHFHRQLYMLSNNEYGLFILDKCLNASLRAYAQFFRNQLRFSPFALVANHEALIDHLEQRNLEAAIETLKKDIRSLRI